MRTDRYTLINKKNLRLSAVIDGLCWFLFCFFFWPGCANAHLVNTGFGAFYDGILHLIVSPDDLLSVLAMTLLAGLGGARHGRIVLFTVTAAWLMGGLLGLQIGKEISWPVITICCLLIAGALVAADLKLPLWLVFGLASLIGMVCGFLNGTAMAQAGGGLRAMLGIASGVFVIAALISAGVVSLKKDWMRIAIRIAGSWITAIGLLMLGWLFKGVT